MTQDIETAASTELTEAAEAELVQGALEDLGDQELTLPILSLTQQLSKVVASGKRESGRYVNSLTGKDYGDSTELVIVYTFKGRFYSDRRSGDVFSAAGDTAPAFWPDKYAGKRFDELDDAEETYRERVNGGDIEWESGPPIRTTFNYVGFIPEDPAIPVRLSLMRTSKRASDKIQAIIRWSLKAPWHAVIELGVDRQTDSQDNPYFVTTAEQGRETTPDERQQAVAMHQQVVAAKDRLNLSGDSDEKAEASAGKRKAAEGSDGLDVA